MESNMEELEEDEIWEAMTRSKGFDKAALEVDIDDDELDLEMQDLPSDYAESSDAGSEDLYLDEIDKRAEEDLISLEDDDKEDIISIEDDEEEDDNEMEEELDDGEISSGSGDDLSGFFEDEDFSDSELALLKNAQTGKGVSGSKKKPKQLERLSSIATKLGYKGGYFDEAKNANEFASADDFSTLIEQQESDFDGEEESQEREQEKEGFRKDKAKKRKARDTVEAKPKRTRK